MTIRTRITGMILALTSTVTLGSAVALYVAERRALVERTRQSFERLADQFARAGRDALMIHDDLAAVNAAQTLAKTPCVTQAFILGSNRKVVGHSRPGFSGKKTDEAPAPGVWRIARALDGPGSTPNGLAVVDVSRQAVDMDIHRSMVSSRRRIAGVALAGLAGGLLGAWLLARTLTRPILTLSLGARALAQGRLDHRVPPLGNDELGVLADDFNVMAERLGEVDALKNAFVANVTHELRSPISAIESCASLISDELRAGEITDIPDQITVVRNNATRLGRLVNHVLDLSRIDAGVTELQHERMPARDPAAEVEALFRAKAEEKSIRLSVGPIPEDLMVWADPDKLAQILTNFVGNALKFTPSGGQVTIGARSEGAGTTFYVQDTGPGIREEDQARVFERFEQVKQSRDQLEGPKGSGLGLAIVKGLAQAHGGRVGLHSTWGQGSLFTVWFPEMK